MSLACLVTFPLLLHAQQPITEKDLPKIQKEMKRLIKRNLAIRREEVGQGYGAWLSLGDRVLGVEGSRDVCHAPCPGCVPGPPADIV